MLYFFFFRLKKQREPKSQRGTAIDDQVCPSYESRRVAMNQIEARYPLRDYQQNWIEQIVAAWNRGIRRVLAQLPTAAGKTVAVAHISNDFFKEGKKVLVIAHRLELVEQAAEKLSAVIGSTVGIIKHGFPLHPERNIQVASIQSLVRRNLAQILPSVGLLICDEAHLACASSYRQIFSFYQKAWVLGVTATPQRTDGQGLKDLFEHLVEGISTSTLIQQGVLSQFRLFATDQTISTVGIKKSRGDFLASELALAVNSQVGVADVFDNWRKYAAGLRTVIFASSLEHSKALAEHFLAQGVAASHLDGDTDLSSRRDILKRFRSGQTQVITNYQILAEGYDCPELECVYCVRPTESQTLWLQMLGRVLRTSPNKSGATIIDLTDNWKKHGLPDDERDWSLEPASAKRESHRSGLRQCSHCTHVFKPLDHEMVPVEVEVGCDGLLIGHHQAVCPHCGGVVQFQTSESKHYNRRLKLKESLHPSLKEIELRVSSQRIEQVYALIVSKRLRRLPTQKAYSAIMIAFIERIAEFTLGDWREIVKLVEPDISKPTAKAWQLYQEALVRHQNRLAALAHLQKRSQLRKNRSEAGAPDPSQNDRARPGRQNSSKLGNPRFQQKYAQEWKKSLNACSEETANFFRLHAGLFFVEKKISGAVNISIEVNEPVGLRRIKQTEIERAFSRGFDGQVNVMFRVSLNQSTVNS